MTIKGLVLLRHDLRDLGTLDTGVLLRKTVDHLFDTPRFATFAFLHDPSFEAWAFTVNAPHGTGVSLGEVSRADGVRTSALRFSTGDRWSPIRSGRGFWRYEPAPGGSRFVTGYDYDPGWGPLDVLVRPLLGWATSWSFDRLRIWLEVGLREELLCGVSQPFERLSHQSPQQ